MTLVARVHRRLEIERIAHALIGAAALAAYGISRSTLDLDLLVQDRRCLDEPLWQPLASENVAVEIRRGDSEDPLAGVVRLVAEGERPVDVIVGRSPWQAEVLERAATSGASADGVAVVSAPDLVLLKLFAGGAQDRWDILQVLAATEREEIERSVDREIGRLPSRCARLWAEIRAS